MINIRKCNNNIILATENGQDVIVLGKGVGFITRPGEEVDMSLVEKVYVPQEKAQLGRFKDILADLPYEIVILAGKIVELGKQRLSQYLNQSIVIALADHFNFALSRIKSGMEIELPLVWDIKHIYPAEYKLGKEALGIVKSETGIELPEAEAAAVALHFINAESDHAEMPDTIIMLKIIKKSVAIVEAHYKTILNENTSDFNGFITLLRNTIMRFLYHKDEKQVEEDIELYELLRKRYAPEVACAEKIALLIQDHNWQVTRNDISFLTLYISRVTAFGGSK